MKKYNRHSIKSIIAGSIAILYTALPAGVMAQNAQITHNPTQVETIAGDTFEVILEINPNGEQVSVVDMHMHFDPTYLEVQEIVNLQQGFSGNLIAPEYDNAAGTISMASFELGSTLPAGNFEAVKITFKALLETTETNVIHPMDIFPKTLLAYEGINKLGSIGDLNITILASDIVSDGLEESDVSNLALWPNPTMNHAFISFTAKQATEATLELYDLTGKKLDEIFRGNVAPGVENRFEIDVRHLASGVYMCRLITDEGNVGRKLIVGK